MEGDDGWYFCFELLGSIEDGPVTPYRDDEGYQVVVLTGHELQAGQVLMLGHDLSFRAGVGEVVEGFRSLGDDADGLLDQLEDLILLVDAADHQNREHWFLHRICLYLRCQQLTKLKSSESN